MFERKIEIHQEEAFEGLETAKRYAENAQKSTMRYRSFLERLKSLGLEGRYLDVGAGPGVLAGIIAQNYPNVEITALELSAAMVKVGKECLASKGLQDRIKFVIGDAEDEELMPTLGQFDLIYSTYALHFWQNPRQVIDNLMANLADNGVLLIHDLRRVWWLYYFPIRSGFIKSVRGSYVRAEVEEILKGLSPECYEIKNEFPFLHTLIIRKPTN
jgi:SAM-dependent methyltransferase